MAKSVSQIRFMYPNPDMQEFYAKHFGLRTISEGRTFKLEDFSMIKCLKEAVEFQGWEYFLGISEKVYYGVVRAFYSQLKTSDSSTSFAHLTSIIRDVELEVRPTDLVEVTKSPYDGHICSPFDGWWKQMKITEGQVSEALTGSSSVRVKSIKTNDLTPEVRGIYHLVQHTILPRSGSTDVLIGLDYMLLYCMVKKLKINLPRLIMDYMASTVSKEKKSHAALPYGMLLTKIFKQVGFPLKSEEKKEKGKTFTMASFRNLLTARQEKKAGKAPAEASRKRKMILPKSESEKSSSSSSSSSGSESDAIKAEPLRAGKARETKKRKEEEKTAEAVQEEEEEDDDDDTLITFRRRDKLPIRRKQPSPSPQPKHQRLSASIKLAEELFSMKEKESSSEESGSDSEEEDAEIQEAVRQSLH